MIAVPRAPGLKPVGFLHYPSRVEPPNSCSAVRAPRLFGLVTALLNWFSASARDLPWRRTRDPYAIWVSEIMLQQTQVKTVIPYWERWMRELPTVEAASRASSEKIHKLWEGLGYYTRARNLQQAAQQIMERHGGQFPRDFEDVLALPGIGRYTAGAICSIAFNQPSPILDGNVIRVLTRVFGLDRNPKEKETNNRLWELAERLVAEAARRQSSGSSRREEAHFNPKNNQSLLTPAATTGCCSALNQSLMELGALVCLPRNPQCKGCPVKRLCVAFRDGHVEQLPNLGPRPVATARRFVALAVEYDGCFLVRQRPAGVVNAHLWEFPNMEIGAQPQREGAKTSVLNGKRTCCGSIDPRSDSVAEVAAQLFGAKPAKILPLGTVRHSITRYRITLEAYVVRLEKPRRRELRGQWRNVSELEQLAFSSAHKRILEKLKARASDLP